MVGSGSSNCIVGIIQSSNPEVILCMIVSRVFQCDVIGCEHSHPVKKKKSNPENSYYCIQILFNFTSWHKYMYI